MATVTASRHALEDLGSMRGGFSGRGQRARTPGPDRLRALQAGDLPDRGSIDWSNLRWVQPERGVEANLVREDDVLVSLRSMPVRAFVATGVPDNVFAFGHWALLTVDRGRVLPAYLRWYLNHPLTTARIERDLLKGSKIKFVSLRGLRGFEVQVPPLATQRQVARASDLQERLEALELELRDARRRLVDEVTMQAVRSSKREAD